VLVVFDWDGTLCDSVLRIVLAMQAAASDCNVTTPSDQEVRHIIGLGLPQAMEVLFPDAPDKHLDLAKAYSRHFSESQLLPDVALFSGISELLARLRDGGATLAVATGKSRRGLNRVLSELGMETVFAHTRCADETRSKPHPLMLEELLNEAWVPSERAIMVGDSIYDVAMAEQAGIASVGVTYGVHSREQLLVHKPLAVVDDVQDLGLVLDTWCKGLPSS
jgi:phosphoglycolate phosphatase